MEYLFERIGKNSKDHKDSNDLDEIDVGDNEEVHVLFLALAKRHRIMIRSSLDL